MANLMGFNANEVKPNEGFEPVPAGDYIACIIESEQKANSSGTGTYLKLTLQIVEGQYANRKLFENLNLDNPNSQTVQIARGTLSAICRAVNVLEPNDSAELHDIPMLVKVGLEKRKDTNEMQNRIRGYKPKNAQAAAPAGNAAAGGATPPWMKK